MKGCVIPDDATTLIEVQGEFGIEYYYVNGEDDLTSMKILRTWNVEYTLGGRPRFNKTETAP